MREILVAALLLASFPALAQESRKYAVLSLLGDVLLVVQHDMTTGSHLDRNTRTRIEVTNAALDNAMVLAVDREIARVEPRAVTVLLGTRSAELFAVQSRALEAGDGVQRILDALRDVVSGTDATHLVLVTKHRDEARLKVEHGTVGAGKLEGLGFYVDPTLLQENREAHERTEGVIAPFAYYMVSLVELRGGKVLAQRAATESHAIGTRKGFTPWLALPAQEKVAMLQGLIRVGAERVVPEVLKAGSPEGLP